MKKQLAAVALIQSATLPALYSVIFKDGLLPLSMPIMLAAGLGVLFWYAVKEKNTIYTWCNGSGFALNLAMIAALLLK